MSVVPSHTNLTHNADNDVIDVRWTDVTTFLRRSRRTVLLFAGAGLALGLLVGLLKHDQYTAQLTLMPEVSAKAPTSSSLGSLAAAAGINLSDMGAQADAVRPDLYPNVLESVPFALHLLKQPVFARDQAKVLPLETYMQQKINESASGRLLGLIRSDVPTTLPDPKNYSQAIQLTSRQQQLVKDIHRRIVTTFDKKTGIITIAATMPDPVVAATATRLALEYLTSYVTSYRTGKAQQQVAFLNRQVQLARRRYEAAEYTLSSYRDRNRSLFLNTAKIEEQRLQADYLLAQSVYNDLAKQLEQARIKVQEETPVLKLLEPAQVPLQKSGPNRLLFAIVGAVLAGMLGLAVSIYRWLRSQRNVVSGAS